MGSSLPMIGFAVGLCMAGVFSAEIYVSPSGNDSAAGTIAAPLATLTAARIMADQLKATNTPVTVFLRGGTYYLSAPVVFGTANSGSATAPIVYTAYGTETPVINGGIKLTNQTWSVSSGSIMKTTIAKNLKVDQLFLNGQRQVLARYPNFNNNVQLQGYSADALTKAAACANPAEGPGYIRAIASSGWGGVDYIITGKNGNSVNYTFVGDNQRTSTWEAPYLMVENIYELLDTVGEWFYRKSTGDLFFWPPAGTNLSTTVIELASQDELVQVVGTSPSAPVSYLSFQGLTFTETYRAMFDTAQKYVPLLMGDWCIMRAGAVFMQNAANINVECCNFNQVGGNGIFMSGYNRNHVIFNNTFTDGGASCVAMCGLPSAVRCACTWSSSVTCNDSTPGPLTDEYPAYILVDNNTMYDFGRFEKQVAGVELSATMCDTIRHNTIYHCPRAGINFNDGRWGGHVVEYNKVYQVVLETDDHGPINSWGRDRNWGCADNWDYVPSLTASKLDPLTPTIIRHNYLQNSDTNFFGIDLDDGSTNYSCHDNVVIGGGFKMQRGRFNQCVNNIILGGGTLDIHDPMPQCGDTVRHNIIAGYAFADWCCGFATSPMNQTGEPMAAGAVARGVLCDSNCYWGYGTTPIIFAWDGDTLGTARSSTACTFAQWQAGGNDAHTRIANPLFVDPASDNYQVGSGSPALALGFKNFAMDSFGVMPVACGTATNKVIKGIIQPVKTLGTVRYSAGRLIVSNDGDYRVTIITASGKVVGRFSAKGDASFIFNSGKGMYLVNLATKKGFITRRLFIY